MRRTKVNKGFFICLLINILLNFEGSIPAWIFLGLHLWLEVPPIWFFWGALAIWMLGILGWMLVMDFASKNATPSRKNRKNANPYSSKTRDMLPSDERK